MAWHNLFLVGFSFFYRVFLGGYWGGVCLMNKALKRLATKVSVPYGTLLSSLLHGIQVKYLYFLFKLIENVEKYVP
jgi:hypothetical protein